MFAITDYSAALKFNTNSWYSKILLYLQTALRRGLVQAQELASYGSSILLFLFKTTLVQHICEIEGNIVPCSDRSELFVTANASHSRTCLVLRETAATILLHTTPASFLWSQESVFHSSLSQSWLCKNTWHIQQITEEHNRPANELRCLYTAHCQSRQVGHRWRCTAHPWEYGQLPCSLTDGRQLQRHAHPSHIRTQSPKWQLLQ